MKAAAPVAILGLGVLIVCAALIYAAIVVGVPTQDPTPAIAASEAHVEHVSNWWISIGIILILFGTLSPCFCRLLHRRAHTAGPDGTGQG
jgi:heme/copper-type cytochrome/quinol oxidase subunit 2